MGDSTIQRVEWASAGLTTSVTAYTSGDMLGTQTTVDLGDAAVSGGTIVGGLVIDKAAVIGAVDLFIFSGSVSQAADNAANSWSDADMAKLLCVVQLTNVYTSALNKVVDTGAALLGKPISSASPNLYICAVTRTANSFFGAVGDLLYSLWIESNDL